MSKAKFTITLNAEVAELINDLLPFYPVHEPMTVEEKFNLLLNEALRQGLTSIKNSRTVKVDVRYDN